MQDLLQYPKSVLRLNPWVSSLYSLLFEIMFSVSVHKNVGSYSGKLSHM